MSWSRGGQQTGSISLIAQRDGVRAQMTLRGPARSCADRPSRMAQVSPVSGMLKFDASPKSNSKSSFAGGISGADPVFSEQRALQHTSSRTR